jgi:hypothetical protein
MLKGCLCSWQGWGLVKGRLAVHQCLCTAQETPKHSRGTIWQIAKQVQP